ncbi:hypothetical protein [Kingella oralis]
MARCRRAADAPLVAGCAKVFRLPYSRGVVGSLKTHNQTKPPAPTFAPNPFSGCLYPHPIRQPENQP